MHLQEQCGVPIINALTNTDRTAMATPKNDGEEQGKKKTPNHLRTLQERDQEKRLIVVLEKASLETVKVGLLAMTLHWHCRFPIIAPHHMCNTSRFKRKSCDLNDGLIICYRLGSSMNY